MDAFAVDQENLIMYLGAQIRSARAPRRRMLRGLGAGEMVSSTCFSPAVKLPTCPPGYTDLGPAGFGGSDLWNRCCMPPAPSAPAATGPITVSPVISTQVSPQISPQFIQQFQPSGSPVAAGASMAPSIIPYPQAPQYQGRTYESKIPQEYSPSTTQASLELPAPSGPVVQERAPSIPSDLTAMLSTPEGVPIAPAKAYDGINWALWAALAASGIAVVFLLTRKGKK